MSFPIHRLHNELHGLVS